MPTYSIRFLKPDDSYAKAVIVDDFANDAAVSEYVRASYGQKALEIWEGKRRVARRVSGAHEARAKGLWPQSCRYPALSVWSPASFERRGAVLPFGEFEMLGRASQSVFDGVKAGLAQHPVWVRAVAHPAAPPRVPSVRLSFHPARRDADQWVGWTTLSVFAPADDGPAIVEDIVGAATEALTRAHDACRGMAASKNLKIKPLLTVGVTMSGGLDGDWSLAPAPPAAKTHDQ